MKMVMSLLFVALSVLTPAQSLKELATQFIGDLGNRVVAQKVDERLQGALDKLGAKMNEGKSLVLPDGSIVGLEIYKNDTRFSDEQLVAAVRGQVRFWGNGLQLGPNFRDREELSYRNRADRDNEELRNPTGKGRAERPGRDIIVTATDSRGFENFGTNIGDWVRRLFGGNSYFDLYRDTEFIEISIEVKDAETQVSDAESGNFTAIGADNKQQSLSVGSGSFGFRSDRGNDGNGALRDAVSRLTRVLRGDKKK